MSEVGDAERRERMRAEDNRRLVAQQDSALRALQAEVRVLRRCLESYIGGCETCIGALNVTSPDGFGGNLWQQCPACGWAQEALHEGARAKP